MSSLAMAAHHHKHHHGTKTKLPHVKLPSLHDLEAKASSLMSVAEGHQGPGPQHMFQIGLLILAVIIFIAWRKRRRA